ncbi:MAG: peptidylprolyl isomerase [Rubricoccaceae bacterium]|nr:peptidylprolyl isomerase [Rubricoccaceae bacterium]
MLRPPAVLLVLALSLPAAAQVPDGAVLDAVVAVVGDQPVLASEVEALAASVAPDGGVTDEVWSRALDEIIGQYVFVERAEQDTTVVVTDDQVNRQLDARIAQLESQIGGRARLEAYYGLPVEEIRMRFRDDVRRQLLAQQYQGRRLREVTITPTEVREWFATIPAEQVPEVPELVRVAQVVKVPAPDDAAEAEARAFAEALRDSILAGQATIEALARRHTDDRASAARGGLYESVNVRDLVPEFGIVAGTLEPGGISQVFETAFGYHVLRLNERQGDVITFNHILVRVDDAAVDPAAVIEALRVLRDSVVVHGVPFEAIARRHSEDPISASRGGALTDEAGSRDLQLDLLGEEWQATLDTLEVGEVSAPAEVRLLDGSRAWHLVLLQRRTPPHRLAPETDYALLSQYALREKQGAVLDTWLRDLRETVYVEIKSDRYVPEA